MPLCDDCGGHFVEGTGIFSRTSHHCPPRWDVWSEEEPDSVRTVRAIDAEDAATVWAERDDSDSAEYGIARGGTARVCVRPHDSDVTPDVFEVTGEYNPEYYAREVEL